MEIERKFTVKQLPDLERYDSKELVQGYICTDPVVRARKEDDSYYLTYKGRGLLSREEYNLPLNETAFQHIIQKADGIIIHKTRYLIPYGKHTIELDVFHGELEPLVMAEVEFDTEGEAHDFVMPDWFLKDVTMDKRYHNSNLSRDGYTEERTE